jgi:hypothetical protein
MARVVAIAQASILTAKELREAKARREARARRKVQVIHEHKRRPKQVAQS